MDVEAALATADAAAPDAAGLALVSTELTTATGAALVAASGAVQVTAQPATGLSSGPEQVIDGTFGVSDLVDGMPSTATGVLDGTQLKHVAASITQASTGGLATVTAQAPACTVTQSSAGSLATGTGQAYPAEFAASASAALATAIGEAKNAASGARTVDTGLPAATGDSGAITENVLITGAQPAFGLSSGPPWTIAQSSTAGLPTGTGQGIACTVTQLSTGALATGTGQGEDSSVTQLSDADASSGTGQAYLAAHDILVLAALAVAIGAIPAISRLILMDAALATGTGQTYFAASPRARLSTRMVITADGREQTTAAHIGSSVHLSATLYEWGDDVTPVVADFGVVFDINDGNYPQPDSLDGALQSDGSYEVDWTVTPGRGPITIHATGGVAGCAETECLTLRRRA